MTRGVQGAAKHRGRVPARLAVLAGVGSTRAGEAGRGEGGREELRTEIERSPRKLLRVLIEEYALAPALCDRRFPSAGAGSSPSAASPAGCGARRAMAH